MDAHADLQPSAWVERWAPLIRPGGMVLDLACGAGRHSRWLARMGFEVSAVDRDTSLFADPPPGVALLEADLESSGPWPYPGVARPSSGRGLRAGWVSLCAWPINNVRDLCGPASAISQLRLAGSGLRGNLPSPPITQPKDMVRLK